MAEKQSIKKPFRVLKISIAVFVLALVLFIIFRVYFTAADDKLARITAQSLRLPIAFVSHSPITFNKYYARADLAKELSGNELTVGDREAIVEGLINDLVTKKLLSAMNVQVSETEANEYFEYLKKVTLTDASERYRLAVSDAYMKENIAVPDLNSIRLQTEHSKNKALNPSINQRADQVLSMLKNGLKFEDLAKQYSEDPLSAEIGGEVGFVGSKDIVYEIYSQLKDLKADQPTIVPSRFGLHILVLENIDNNGPDKTKRYDLKQIYLENKDFEKWFNQQKAELTITRLK